MGFWSKVGKIATVAKTYIPLAAALPIPDKAKTAIVKGAQIEQETEDLVRELKKKPDQPLPPAA